MVDTTGPLVTVPADITTPATGPAGAPVSFSASASDLVDGSLVPLCVPASGSTFAIADTLVTCSVDDAAGNPGSASFHVIVTAYVPPPDTTDPLVDVPGDITAEATGTAGAIVSYSASASDDVDGDLTPTCLPVSGGTFPLGDTLVTCSATDAASNTGSAELPRPRGRHHGPPGHGARRHHDPATGPSGAPVSFSASASDLVDGSLAPVCVPASGSTFAIADTLVTCSVTDAAGNPGSAPSTSSSRPTCHRPTPPTRWSSCPAT